MIGSRLAAWQFLSKFLSADNLALQTNERPSSQRYKKGRPAITETGGEELKLELGALLRSRDQCGLIAEIRATSFLGFFLHNSCTRRIKPTSAGQGHP
jgi:hypothetical protein